MRLTITEQQQIKQCIDRITAYNDRAARKAIELLADIKREQEEFEGLGEYVDGVQV